MNEKDALHHLPTHFLKLNITENRISDIIMSVTIMIQHGVLLRQLALYNTCFFFFFFWSPLADLLAMRGLVSAPVGGGGWPACSPRLMLATSWLGMSSPRPDGCSCFVTGPFFSYMNITNCQRVLKRPEICIVKYQRKTWGSEAGVRS